MTLPDGHTEVPGLPPGEPGGEPAGSPVPAEPRHNWRRVVLKLSGEAFAGGEPLGISPDVVIHVAKEIAAYTPAAFQIAAVVVAAAIIVPRSAASPRAWHRPVPG